MMVNLVVCVVLMPVFRALKTAQGQDTTTPADYVEVEAAFTAIPAVGD
jgi:hypothetical protein